jgi:uncharacterized protein (DUF58 family)
MIDPEILKQVRLIQVKSNRLVTDVMSGGYSSVFRGSGIEFDEVREYVEGDDQRSVDWNVTARVGRPYIKKYVEERELTVVFLVALSASSRGGAGRRSVREAAAELSACLALSAIRNNDKVGLIAFTDAVERYVPPKKGIGHVLRIVRDCLALEPSGTKTNLVPALELAARVLRRRAILFLVSDFLTEGYERELALCGRRHDLIAVRLLPPELELAGRGLLRVRDLETGAEHLVDASSPRVRASHQRSVAAWKQRTRETLLRAGVDIMDVPIDRSVVDPILAFFQMRERRGAHR